MTESDSQAMPNTQNLSLADAATPQSYDPGIPLTDVTGETQRQLNICNACRYCEGFCPVFPAITRRRWFDEQNKQDVEYLAHLCHNCTACYHACQYKPPHTYSVNLPLVLAKSRFASIRAHAWPSAANQLFNQSPLMIALGVILTFIFLTVALYLSIGPAQLFSTHSGPGAFYNILPHGTIVLLAASCLLLGLGGMTLAWWRYSALIGLQWQQTRPAHVLQACREAATLKHLGGGQGQGCNTTDEGFSNTRRYYHQFTMWGFALCFAATSVATVYELGFGWISPFPLTSLPVLLGIFGGIGLIVGPVGLLMIKKQMPAHQLDEPTVVMDKLLCWNLLCISLSGFALMLLRESEVMGVLLSAHLSLVLVFFITLPFSKFIHAGYRFLSLVKASVESPQ